MTVRTGRTAIVEQLLADKFEYIFGNPGTVEQGLLDTLQSCREIEYVLALQESIAVLVADGYARAKRRPALVQVHSSPGTGNAIGNLYQSKRGGTPLVVIAGEAGVRYDAMDAQMAADLCAMARPVTKWATRVVDPSSVLRVLRRAIKIASTPPMGPVFVSLPADVLDQPNNEEVLPTSVPVTETVPAPQQIAKVAAMLASAERPMILMGDGVSVSGAQAELTRVAELVGAEVWGSNSSEVNMSYAHPLYRGTLGHMFGFHSREIVSRADAVLIVGTYVFPEVFPALAGVFAEGARVAHIDLDAYEIAKNFPVDVGLVCDPKPTLGLLAAELDRRMTRKQRDAAEDRATRARAEKERANQAQRKQDEERGDTVPMAPARFMKELLSRLPLDAIVFDEGLTSSDALTRYLTPATPGSYFQTRGGSLGTGIPGAIGVKLANPDRTVVGFTGDGGSMYTIQALWTAAHHKIGAKLVICNNHSYKLLKQNIQQYWRDLELPEGEFPSNFDLKDPDIQFAELARSMGVASARVERPEEIAPAVRRMLEDDAPFLIDLIIDDEVPGHFVYHKCGQ